VLIKYIGAVSGATTSRTQCNHAFYVCVKLETAYNLTLLITFK